MFNYIPRIADKQLRELLNIVPTVLIEGPKYAGKTETARQSAKSEVLLDVDEDARLSSLFDPGALLEGATPRLIDEWHVSPRIWNHVRRACDDRKLPGQFILTGSSRPSDEVTRHTGAGRIARLHLRTMSLFEQGIADGSVSLRDLTNSQPLANHRPVLSFDDVIEAACRGGWPAMSRLELTACLRYCRAYLEETTRTEILDGTTFDPTRMRSLLVTLARNIATDVSLTTILKDVSSTVQVRTITNYLNVLQRLHVVELQFPFRTHLRSRAQLRLTPKRHLCDPSLAVAALGTNPTKLKSNLRFFGSLFESLVVRDLRVYADANDADVYFYRDNTGLEIDAIVAKADGTWIPFEVKLGGEELIESAAQNLKRLCNKIDRRRAGEPAAMIVIVATPTPTYTRSDGVSVLSIASLGP